MFPNAITSISSGLNQSCVTAIEQTHARSHPDTHNFPLNNAWQFYLQLNMKLKKNPSDCPWQSEVTTDRTQGAAVLSQGYSTSRCWLKQF